MPKVKISEVEARKQLLIAESEVNRSLLLRECQAMKGEFRNALEPIKQIGAVTSSIAVAAALYKALRPAPRATEPKPPRPRPRLSLFGSLLRLGLWCAMRGLESRSSRP